MQVGPDTRRIPSRPAEATVERCMTADVQTCRPFDCLLDAARRMMDEGLGCLPVVAGDGSGRVVGMLTDRDVSMAAARDGDALRELQVRSAMTVSVQSCAAHDSVSSVLEKMSAHGVSRLPVLDRNGRLRGLISLTDLAQAATREQEPTVHADVCRAVARGATRRATARAADEGGGR